MKITEQELSDAYRFRAYARPKRPGMGWFNKIFVAMVFLGGTAVYDPGAFDPIRRVLGTYQAAPLAAMRLNPPQVVGRAPATEQELFFGAKK